MLATLALAAALSGPQTARLDAVMRYVMHDRGITGMTVGIVRDGAVTIRAYGGAKRDYLYPIGSLSKAIVAATALRLADAGAVSLQMRVGQIDADFVAASHVTLMQLLTQTSGIADYSSQPGFDRASRAVLTPRELVAPVAALPLRFTAGSDLEYSNTNYVLAALAIEAATRKTLIAQEHNILLDPLHMNATHRWLGSYLLYGAGDLESNASDMCTWMQELLRPRVLTPGDVEQLLHGTRLQDGTRSPYGMGFYITDVFGLRAATTSGFAKGFSAYMALVRSKHAGAVLLSNGDRIDLGPAAKSALAATLDIPE